MDSEGSAVRSRDVERALAALAEVATELTPIQTLEVVASEAMPSNYRLLLAHHGHMTPTLRAYHAGPIALRVLSWHNGDGWYGRRILLTTAGGRHVVEFGVVRLDLSMLPDEVCSAVLERRRPLGDILIDHGVLTRVEPRWFLRFGPDHPVAAHLPAGSTGACFGRLATIHCNGRAAMELLEVVTDARA